jgi:hypothetical protein
MSFPLDEMSNLYLRVYILPQQCLTDRVSDEKIKGLSLLRFLHDDTESLKMGHGIFLPSSFLSSLSHPHVKDLKAHAAGKALLY